MRIIKTQEQYKKSINEGFLGNIMKGIVDRIKNKASIKISKLFGTAKEADKIFTGYEQELTKSTEAKYNSIKTYLNYVEQVSAGGGKNEKKSQELLNNIKSARTQYDKNADIISKKIDIQLNELIKKEKNDKIKDYIQLRKLELQQTMIAKELQYLDTNITDQMKKSDPKISTELGVVNLENRFKESENNEQQILNKFNSETESTNNQDNSSFNLEQAKKDSKYLWKSKYVNNYKFKQGEEIVFFSNSDNDKENYKGTTAYISSDEQQKQPNVDKNLEPDQIWITKDKNNLNSGFVINKGKIISVKNDTNKKTDSQTDNKTKEVNNQM